MQGLHASCDCIGERARRSSLRCPRRGRAFRNGNPETDETGQRSCPLQNGRGEDGQGDSTDIFRGGGHLRGSGTTPAFDVQPAHPAGVGGVPSRASRVRPEGLSPMGGHGRIRSRLPSVIGNAGAGEGRASTRAADTGSLRPWRGADRDGSERTRHRPALFMQSRAATRPACGPMPYRSPAGDGWGPRCSLQSLCTRLADRAGPVPAVFLHFHLAP
jgi:hypothetical protein